VKPIEHDIIEYDPDPDRTDRAALIALYEEALQADEAMREPRSLPAVDFVEFLRVLEIRFGGNRRSARCCRSRRGIRCPFCHPEAYR
jgi:hypothetical protein